MKTTTFSPRPRSKTDERSDAFKRGAGVAVCALVILSFLLATGCASTGGNNGPKTVDDVLSAQRPSW